MDLKFLPRARRNKGRNFKSTTLGLALLFTALPNLATASDRLAPMPAGSLFDHGRHFEEPAESPADMIPQGRVASGAGLTAWFAGATERYGHAVLGDAIEAGRLVVSDGNAEHVHDLDRDSVFEDLEPRIVDADGDGRPEILTIKSYLRAGATIALYGLRDGALAALAEAPPIGTPHRWLNPAGVADYDGDGAPEIALIETPHIGGILILYRWDGGAGLKAVNRLAGYSTHRIGSTVLAMSHSHDWTGDGVVDLLLPRQNRAVLALVTAAGGTLREIAHVRHKAEIVTRLVEIAAMDGGAKLLYGLADGSAWTLSLPGAP